MTRLGAYFRAGERFRIAGDLDLDLARSADRSLWRMMREATTWGGVAERSPLLSYEAPPRFARYALKRS